jgi:hypothetical protein
MSNYLKLEELGLTAVALLGLYYQPLQFSWWVWILLFFTPDVGMLGYIVNPQIGAITYNLLHHKLIAIIIMAAGYFFYQPWLTPAGLIMFGHSSLDRVLGYGLKYPDSFKHTHLGWM